MLFRLAVPTLKRWAIFFCPSGFCRKRTQSAQRGRMYLGHWACLLFRSAEFIPRLVHHGEPVRNEFRAPKAACREIAKIREARFFGVFWSQT